jgi:catechol 2,3-dioxygenase-like lactoylglutathione lyase family enzyme
MKTFIPILSLIVLWPLAASWAQLRPPSESGVSLGQVHAIVRDIDASKKFWTLMGGTAIKVDGTDVMKFPGVLLFLTLGSPSGGSSGTPMDHIGFWVTDGPELVARLKAENQKTDPNAGERVPGVMNVGYVYSPDDLKIEVLDLPNVRRIHPELLENKSLKLIGPSTFDHLHYMLPEAVGPEARAWYAKTFGASLSIYHSRTGAPELGDELSGTRLNFGKSNKSVVPTKGRALDHIGFEVKHLQAFCEMLEASGVKLDQPYSKARHKSFASAELTDPWGTSIELTEGLDKF